ncbi:hypothetical protein [Streptomyces sp. NPDC002133]|uniref:hypothetical protein n=1 Tax=Streptomyces sp. NPDC002133 TaxID=3154409 RepID=UPI003330071C
MRTVTLVGGPMDGRTRTVTPFDLNVVAVERATAETETHHSWSPELPSGDRWVYRGARTHDAGASQNGCAGDRCNCSQRPSILGLMIDLGHTPVPTRRDPETDEVTHWRCTNCDRDGYGTATPGGTATLHPCR